MAAFKRTIPVHHMNGGAVVSPQCAYCGQPEAFYKGNDGHKYCNEFCCDSASDNVPFKVLPQ